MERLNLKYEQLQKAYKQLAKIINLFLEKKNNNAPEEELIVYQDSLIQRFEICFDLTWKYIKTYLEDMLGIIAKSPKAVFQESFKQDLFDENTLRFFLSMVDDRNTTTHVYDEETVREIGGRITDYYKIMKNNFDNLKPSKK